MLNWKSGGFWPKHRNAMRGFRPGIEWGARFFERVPRRTLEMALEHLAKPSGLICTFGPRGLGKTQLATWLSLERAHQAAAEGHEDWTSHYTNLRWLLRRTKRGFDSNDHSDIDRATNCDLLVLDECLEVLRPGKPNESTFDYEEFVELVDTRYGMERATILIGNFADEDELRSSLGDSVHSRLCEATSGLLIECSWEPYR